MTFDDLIAKELNLEMVNGLEEAIKSPGYYPFATIKTERERYFKDGFYLDFDEVKDLDYATLEVELMVNAQEEIASAENKILDFAKQHGLTKPGRSKVIEYLFKNNPEHYRILKNSGVIRD